MKLRRTALEKLVLSAGRTQGSTGILCGTRRLLGLSPTAHSAGVRGGRGSEASALTPLPRVAFSMVWKGRASSGEEGPACFW